MLSISENLKISNYINRDNIIRKIYFQYSAYILIIQIKVLNSLFNIENIKI